MEPPEGSSTVVSARFTDRAGMVTPGTVPVTLPSLSVSTVEFKEIAPSLDSSETSVETRSEIRPSDNTTGVKPRPTPKGLNSMVTLPSRSRPTGTGNSPPARNCAGSPEMAVMLGSASVRTSPTRSSAFSVAEMELCSTPSTRFRVPIVPARPPSAAPATPKAFEVPQDDEFWNRPGWYTSKMGAPFWSNSGSPRSLVAAVRMFGVNSPKACSPLRFTPSWRTKVRSISTMRTCKVTWSRPSTVRKETT